MKLYFSPLACSLATRIALYEAGAEATFVEVDGKTKVTSDGSDFLAVHALGLVPALEIVDPSANERAVLTENAAVLQWVADQFPEANLAPRGGLARARLQERLHFIGSELHKAVFVPLLEKEAHAEAKAYALSKADRRLGWLAQQLEGRAFQLDQLSVADAYLFAVLNWSVVTPIKLDRYPALAAFMARMHARPAFARAFGEEKDLYLAELARHAA
jgi:glutathione S-transferase